MKEAVPCLLALLKKRFYKSYTNNYENINQQFPRK